MEKITFDEAVRTLIIAGDTAVAQVGDYALVRFTPEKIIETWKTRVVENDSEPPRITCLSRGTCDEVETQPYVVFGTKSDTNSHLNVWVDGAVIKIALYFEPLSICHNADGYIFVAEDQEISIFKFNEEKVTLQRISVKRFHHKTSKMWLTMKGTNHELYIHTAKGNGYKMIANGLIEPKYELALADPIFIEQPFQNMYSNKSGKAIFFDHYGDRLTVSTDHLKHERIYNFQDPLIQVTHWKYGLILLFNSGYPAIVKVEKDLGDKRSWQYVNDWRYGEVAVLGNLLLLRRGSTVVFRQLPD